MDKETQTVKKVIPDPLSIMVSNKSSWSQGSSSSSNDSAVFCCDLPVKNSNSVLGKHLLNEIQSSSLQKRMRNFSSSSASSSMSCISDKGSNKSHSSSIPISHASLTSADIASVGKTSTITTVQDSPIKREFEDIALYEPDITFSKPLEKHPYKTRRTLRKNIQKKACSCDCTSTCTTLTVQHYKKKGRTVKKETVISKTKVKTFANNSHSQAPANSVLKKNSSAKNNKRRKSEVEQLYDSIHELEWGKNISPDNILQPVNVRQAASASVFGNSKKSKDHFSLNNACSPIKTEALDEGIVDFSTRNDSRKNILIRIQKKSSNKCEIPNAVSTPNQTCTQIPTIQLTLEVKKEETHPIMLQSGSFFSSALSQDVKSASLMSSKEPNGKHESQINSPSISFMNSLFDMADKSLNNAAAELEIASCFENDSALPQLTSMAESFFQKTSPSYDGPPVLEPCVGFNEFQSCTSNQLSTVTRSISLIKSSQSVTQNAESGENMCAKSPVKNKFDIYTPNLAESGHSTAERQVNYLIIAAGRRIFKKYLGIARSIVKIKETIANNAQKTSSSNASKLNFHCQANPYPHSPKSMHAKLSDETVISNYAQKAFSSNTSKSILNCQATLYPHSPKSMPTKLSDEFLQTEREGLKLSPSSVHIAANNKVSRIYRCDTIVTPNKCANATMESPFPVYSEIFSDRKPSENQGSILDTSIDSKYLKTKDNIISPLKNSAPPCVESYLRPLSSDSSQSKSLDFKVQIPSKKESNVKRNLIETYSNDVVKSMNEACPVPSPEVLHDKTLDILEGKIKCISADEKIENTAFSNEKSSIPTQPFNAQKPALLNSEAQFKDDSSTIPTVFSSSKICTELKQILPSPIEDPPKPLVYSAITVLFGVSYVQVTFKSNRLSLEALKELKDVLQRCSKDPKIRSLVLNGTGECFSLGLDLFPLLGPQKIKLAFELAIAIKEFIWELSRFPKPVVAFVTGPAHGLGLTLLTYADLSIASEDATFCMTHAKFGCVPEGGAVVTLPAAIGAVAACGLLSTGKCLTAQEAKRLRLVEEVLPYKDMPNYLVSRLKMMHKQTLSCVETTKALARMNLNCQLVATLENETKFLPNMWLSPVCQEAIQKTLQEELTPQ